MDRYHFKKRIGIRSSVEVVCRVFASGKGLESWFLKKAPFTTSSGRIRYGEERIKKGDSYEWLRHGFPDEVVEHKKILEANGKDHLKFAFTGDSVVSIFISPEQKLTKGVINS